jgi:hypothetical protein
VLAGGAARGRESRRPVLREAVRDEGAAAVSMHSHSFVFICIIFYAPQPIFAPALCALYGESPMQDAAAQTIDFTARG